MIPEEKLNRLVARRDELAQHTLLMVTFTVLAITGFAFHYSGSWWARALFGWPGGFLLRRIVHLVAAALFVVTAVWHVGYLFGARGRAFLRDMWPRGADFRQFFQTMGYDLGLRREAPRFGRFSYIEKAEYWALVWGTVVMTFTGLALWFGNVTERVLEVQALGVMLVVHFYEAVLAGLAILVWHFYSTIFSPTVTCPAMKLWSSNGCTNVPSTPRKERSSSAFQATSNGTSTSRAPSACMRSSFAAGAVSMATTVQGIPARRAA